MLIVSIIVMIIVSIVSDSVLIGFITGGIMLILKPLLNPQKTMLRLLNRVAKETVDSVMAEYTKQVNSGSDNPLSDTAAAFFNLEEVPYPVYTLMSNIEGLCYLVAQVRLPKDLMNMRYAQFCAMVNNELMLKPNKPYTSQIEKIHNYEVLGLGEVYRRSPELFR